MGSKKGHSHNHNNNQRHKKNHNVKDANWRREEYKGQKHVGLFFKPTAAIDYTPKASEWHPSWFTLLMLFTLYVRVVTANSGSSPRSPVNLGASSESPVIEAVHARIVNDINVAETKLNCDLIAKSFEELALHHAMEEEVRAMLRIPGVKLICTTSATISKNSPSYFYYVAKTKSAYISPGLFNAAVANYALKIIQLSHFGSGAELPGGEIEPTTVLLRFNEAELKFLEVNLKIGDKRIMELERLLGLDENELSDNEKLLLKKYLDATKNCLPSIIFADISLEELIKLKKKNYLNGAIFSYNGMKVRVMDMAYPDNRIQMFMEVQSPHSIIRNVESYYNLIKIKKVTNIYTRLTYHLSSSLMSMDSEGMDVFYPEVKAILTFHTQAEEITAPTLK